MASALRPTSGLRHAARLLLPSVSPLAAGTAAARRHVQTSSSAPAASAPAPATRPGSGSHFSNSAKSGSSSSSSAGDPGFTTVNQTEVSHFDALAETWWDPHGSSRLLHLMNPLRHDFIRACHASEPGAPSQQQGQLRYLDVGCGGGIFAESAARLPTVSSVTAIDASTQVLAVARAHLRRECPDVQRRLTYLHSSVEALAAGLVGEAGAVAVADNDNDKGDPRFDVVTTFEVLEHVENPSAFLERCGALVRPGGWLVLSTMARTWVSWATTVLVAEDLLGIVPRGTHDWRKYVDPDELRAWLAARPESEGWAGPGAASRCQGVVYVPGLGWKEVPGSERVGNYFFAARKSPDAR